MCGPSPRARGKLQELQRSALHFRTIPTRAGKTNALKLQREAVADHPHARGENASATNPGIVENGPSPRARGKRFLYRNCLCLIRTIPTRAGKTDDGFSAAGREEDHPHARGENPKKLEIKKRIILYLVIFQLSKNSGSNFQDFCRYEIKHSARTSPKTPPSSLSLDEKSSADTASR